MTPLSGKTALVTSAARGIGRATGLALAKAGAQVLVHHFGDERAAQATVANIRELGGRTEKIAGDLCNPDGPHALARRVRAIVGARLDILVVNTAPVSLIADDDVFDTLFSHYVRSPYFLVQQLMPVMCKGSSIVLVSLMEPALTNSTAPAYAAARGAIDAMVTHFALALSERGIRINAVTPGTQPVDEIAEQILYLSSTCVCQATGETAGENITG
ncbi:SDR family NAD(P)-dependent oxidoreductase [Caballeronia sp. M23-90]